MGSVFFFMDFTQLEIHAHYAGRKPFLRILLFMGNFQCIFFVKKMSKHISLDNFSRIYFVENVTIFFLINSYTYLRKQKLWKTYKFKKKNQITCWLCSSKRIDLEGEEVILRGFSYYFLKDLEVKFVKIDVKCYCDR